MTEKMPCPLMTALSVAEGLLEKHAGIHQHYDATRGRLALMREAAERVHALLPCEPVIAQNGNLVCSLEYWTDFAQHAITVPVVAGNSAIPLDSIVTGKTAGAPIGAML